MKYPKVEHKHVLVTGCSSGIGLATAEMLRDAGWTVYPTARKPDDLTHLEQNGFTPIELDLAREDSVHDAVSRVRELSAGALGALVNNAGFGQAGAMEDISRDALRRQFEVNVFGLHQLTQMLIPGFQTQGYGRIVNVSSIYGRFTAPMVGSYCASKYAVEAMSDALRVELMNCGIAVSLVEPGPIITRFRKNAAEVSTHLVATSESRFRAYYENEVNRRRKQKKEPGLINRPPEAVAEKVRHALESPRPRIRYLVTLPAYIGVFAKWLLPSQMIDRIMLKSVPDSAEPAH